MKSPTRIPGRARPRTGWLPWLGACLMLLLSGIGIAVSDTSSIPVLSLSSVPLYGEGLRAKPMLALALSVEYPTVGAEYRGTNDYSTSTAYIGYFNPDLCYEYDANAQQFNAFAAATNHDCSGASYGGSSGGFSGNFMNWATSSAIDILRYGLTGGDRIVDTDSTTVLQRAVLPGDGVADPTFYNNGANFPAKQLSSSLAAGAVPSSLLTQQDGSSYTGTIYIANCLNHVYFGTASTGSCSNPGSNANLGQLPLAVTSSNTLPNGVTQCAGEGGTCTLPDNSAHQIYFGVIGKAWRVATVSGSVACNNSVFGDPDYGYPKTCYYVNATTTAPTVSSNGGQTATNYFLTRVSVCVSMTGPTADIRYVNGAVRPYCTLYPNGDYKPTGDLQSYSDKVRVAAFGYLLDDNVFRYGGVLRAPMSYLGPTAYDANFNLVSGGNPQNEWYPNTGVFVTNPMGETAYPSSGVVNYLNQFGRTGTPGNYKIDDPVNELYYEALRYLQGLPPTPQATVGMTAAMQDNFPVYDQLGTPQTPTVTNETTNLPTSPNYYDPQPQIGGLGTSGSYSCVKSNILGIGDVHTHYDRSLPGFWSGINLNGGTNDFNVAPNPAGNMPDFSFWATVIAGFETNNAVSYVDGSGVTRNTLGSPLYNTAPNAALTGASSGNAGNGNQLSTLTDPQTAYDWPAADPSNYLMGAAAYWANTHDIRGVHVDNPADGCTSANAGTSICALAGADTVANQRPGMRVTTYMIDVNEGGSDSDLLNARNTQFFIAAKYGGFDAAGSLGGNPFVASDGTYTSSLWQRSGTDQSSGGTDIGGQPQTYFLSSDAATLLITLDNIFASIAADTASIAATPVTTTTVTDATNGSSMAFRSTFDPAGWTGNIWPVTISVDASGNVSFNPASGTAGAVWQAATQFASSDNSNWKNREIYIGNDTTNDGTNAISFKTFSSLTSSEQSDVVGNSTLAGQTLLDYLRGDHSNEAPAATNLRPRSTALGDIVNSGVVYEGAPSTLITDSGYSTFYTANANRLAVVYAGANDGMLHAFNAANGDEMFAYIPSFVAPKLNALTSTSYVHQSYVDATPTVGEAELGSTWKTVLVSGAGAGGQGVFALDVTNVGDPFDTAHNPSGSATFGPSNVLWEFTDKNDADLGNVMGQPLILKFQTNAGSSSAATYAWYAVVPSGVNNYQPDGHASSTGNPAIFLLDLSKPAGTAWQLGVNYFKISLPQSSSAQATGVLNVSAYAPNGVVSRLYAGDLQGNLWEINLSGTSSSGWDSLGSGSGLNNIFIAKDSSGNLQPITSGPTLVGYGNNLILTFGTGQFIASTDNDGSYQTQTAYAVLAPLSGSPPQFGRSDLEALSVSNGNVTGSSFAWGYPTSASNSVYAGWYLDLPNSSTSGERFISDFAVYYGTVYANSIIPAAGGCSEGNSNSYTFNLFNGSGTSVASTVGLLGAPTLLYVGTPSSNGSGSSTSVTLARLNFGSNGVSAGNVPNPNLPTGMRSWRQIFSYKDIVNGP